MATYVAWQAARSLQVRAEQLPLQLGSCTALGYAAPEGVVEHMGEGMVGDDAHPSLVVDRDLDRVADGDASGHLADVQHEASGDLGKVRGGSVRSGRGRKGRVHGASISAIREVEERERHRGFSLCRPCPSSRCPVILDGVM